MTSTIEEVNVSDDHGKENGQQNGKPDRIESIHHGKLQQLSAKFGSLLSFDFRLDELKEIADPFCNPESPIVISFHDVTSAAFKIKGGVEYTPLNKSHLSDITGTEIYLKKEFLQFTGSFKERGARYCLLQLSKQQKARGVISASLGNHAQGLCYHGMKLNIPVTVVMPVTAPIMKITKCKSYGANVIVKGANMKEAKQLAMKLGEDMDLLYVNGYDHPHIMAGQGTIGLEIMEQLPDVDAIVVPVGGGGLIAGIATAVKTLNPNVKIIGVESDKCPSFSEAMKNNGPIPVECCNTLADGLAVPKVGVNAYATALPLIDKMIVVKEEWIALGILRLVELEKCVVEGAGAAGLAAVLAGHMDEFKGKKVAILICGGNIDTTTFGRCLERGLASEGRLMRFTVAVSDRPGGILDLIRLLREVGVSIKDILHERAWVSDIYEVDVKCVVETKDWEHSKELRARLMEKYKYCKFSDLPLAISD